MADHYTLLCERCGYVLEGLAREGACPECGTLIAESVPERRVGSAWQRGAGVRSWVGTGLAVLRHPTALFGMIRLARPVGHGLVLVQMLVSAAVVAGAAFGQRQWARVYWSGADGAPTAFVEPVHLWTTSTALWVSLAAGAGVAVAIWVMTWIETLGLRFYGGRRGGRVTKHLAWAVCAHASYGWLVAVAVPVVTSVVAALWSPRFMLLAMGDRGWSWLLKIVDGFGARWPDWPSLVVGGLVIGGAMAGMTLFETLVYVGIRRCQWGNVLRETSTSRRPGGTPGPPER